MQSRCFSRTAICERRLAFTIVELMVAVLVLSILSSLILFAMTGAMQTARVAQTKARIAKLDRIISDLYDDYLSRRVPFRFPLRPNAIREDFEAMRRVRLIALRDLMRLELPDRVTDVTVPPAIDFNGDGDHDYGDRPVVSKAYVDQASENWTSKYQGAECLYLIVSLNAKPGLRGQSVLSENEIADVDGDGMFEIVDAWGTPIRFARWAPGFDSPLHDRSIPDPFDPHLADPDWHDNDPSNDPFALYPLIISAGPDREWSISFDDTDGITYREDVDRSDPIGNYQYYQQEYDIDAYMKFRDGRQVGSSLPPPNDNLTFDEIHNHLVDTR